MFGLQRGEAKTFVILEGFDRSLEQKFNLFLEDPDTSVSGCISRVYSRILKRKVISFEMNPNYF